jgi:hypothetical protein
MSHDDIARQTEVEHGLLRLLLEGLRTTAAWAVEGPDASRKLSTLRFVVGSFRRHLERLLALEEHDGYLDLVLASAPQLARTTQALRVEHEQFRSQVGEIAGRLECLSATDLSGLAGVCDDVLVLERQVEAHSRKEITLLQGALERDGGGEGG